MVEVLLGLGSNIAPEQHLKHALTKLSAQFGCLMASSVYRSPPFGFTGDDFLNMVARFETGLEVAAVEVILTAIEHAGGRQAVKRGGSRTLDLDLLLYGRMVDPATRLPREDILRYPFVLAPLAELAPDLCHPVTGASMQVAWRAMGAVPPPLSLGPLEALR
jgi:2-amino-4-hydroxy-6-hydroxymethyldihydropteridine diphosphokinase